MTQPNREYAEAAQKVAALVALPDPTPDQLTETRKLRAEMRTAFMSAFNLKPDLYDATRRFYERHVVTESGPDRMLFHNLDFFQRHGDPVIVSQPYKLDIEALDYWAWQRCTPYTLADDWGYHHPGVAKLFIIPFDEEAVGMAKELGKTRRDVEAIRRASDIEREKTLKRLAAKLESLQRGAQKPN